MTRCAPKLRSLLLATLAMGATVANTVAQLSPVAGEVLAETLITKGVAGFEGPGLDGKLAFGGAVATLGDVNGDGIADLAVGAPSGYGAVFILLMQADGSVASHTVIDKDTPALAGALYVTGRFGAALAALGDIDGDGVPDLLVGEPGTYDFSEQLYGALYLVRLQADGQPKNIQRLNGLDLQAAAGAPINPHLSNMSLGTLGDYDDNGVPDVALGQWTDSTSVTGAGAVMILSLGADGSVADVFRIAENEGGFPGPLTAGENFGSSVAALGDVNGDGVDDLAVGLQHENDGGIASGGVWILFLDESAQVVDQQKISNSHGQLGSVLAAGDVFGSALCALGDLDRNGVPDLLVGSRGADAAPHSETGRLWVLLLKADGRVASSFAIDDDTSGGLTQSLSSFDAFGSSLSALTDPDADGVPRIVAGIPGHDAPSAPQSGAVVLLDLSRHVWDDLGQGLAGAAGVPALGAHGSLQGGDPFAPLVSNAPPQSSAWFVVGLGSLSASFKLGVMVPTVDAVFGPFSTDASGAFTLDLTWPDGLPSGFEIFLQFWFTDAGGPVGYSASNGLRGVTP